MATSKTKCFTCDKVVSTYKCGGCLQDFCFNHLTEHRQILGKQFDEIENDRDQFQQILIEQKENPSKHFLIQQINQWENDSIQKIKQTAKECKRIILKHTNEYTVEIESKLIKLTQQLRESRKENEFNEIDLNQFKTKLEKLAKELDQSPNISIRQDSESLINKISVAVSSEQFHSFTQIKLNTKWKQDGITIAGGDEKGSRLNQLCHPIGIYVDDDQTIYIADYDNHRIVAWKCHEKNGQVVAGGNGGGNRNDQLNCPTDVTVDKRNDSLIICDYENRRVMRWSRQNNTSGQIIISDIHGYGLTMDNNGNLYVSDDENNEVRRWSTGDKCGTIVAGGNGRGDRLNQLNEPTFVFIDEDYSVYVSDSGNHRVMKWMKGGKEGIVVAGGKGEGNSLPQLSRPLGVLVDQLGQIYVADSGNDRVMRWCKGAKQGTIVVGGNGRGEQSNQFDAPGGLSFDRQGNLYVSDNCNDRIRKFEID